MGGNDRNLKGSGSGTALGEATNEPGSGLEQTADSQVTDLGWETAVGENGMGELV
jgi:hypothetical protein